jgi:Xaa-Pro aminopeptidase
MSTDAPILTRDTDESIDQARAYEAEQQAEAAVRSAVLAKRILADILAAVKPGVRESEVKAFALDTFRRYGIERTWHQPYIRFHTHTLLTFKEKADEDFTLKEEDIAYVDIGVVKDGIEGDAGATLTFGNSAAFTRLRDASKTIFQEARRYWQAHDPEGIALYQHIVSLAEKMDVRFNLDPAGHLIGAFPHRGWKKGLNRFPGKVKPGAWILEIQVAHKTLPFGAFYEDLLYQDPAV